MPSLSTTTETLLYRICRNLLAETDLKTACQNVLSILGECCDLQRGILQIYDDQTGEIAVRVFHGLYSADLKTEKYRFWESLSAKTRNTGEAWGWSGDLREILPLKRITDFTPNTFICLPVMIQKEKIGILCFSGIPLSTSGVSGIRLEILEEIAELLGLAARVARVESEAKRSLLETTAYLQQALKHRYQLKNVIGVSKQMQEVFAMVEQVSQSRSTILLRGESGTGKELIAHAIHFKSSRAEQPFVKFSCAAIPENLLESELFGHEKGAFTGAIRSRAGRFEQAHGGTIFLDEIGDIPMTMQIKLLRVLQERKFERVGGNRTISVDIRLITATNRNLELAVQQNLFREDLYYRLNVIPVYIAPLRARKDDIPPLVEFFLKKINDDNGKNVELAPECLPLMMQYPWPGNVRELENFIERLIVMARRDIVHPQDLHLPISQGAEVSIGLSGIPKETPDSLSETIEEIEKKQIEDALIRTGGVHTRAARILKLTPRQIRYKLKKYNIPDLKPK